MSKNAKQFRKLLKRFGDQRERRDSLEMEMGKTRRMLKKMFADAAPEVRKRLRSEYENIENTRISGQRGLTEAIKKLLMRSDARNG